MVYLICGLISLVVSVVTSFFMEAYHQRRASDEVGDYDKHRH